MREAIRISIQKMRRNHGGPFGAVVVRHGRIIGRGWNCVTSTNDPTAHAELMAIRQACRRLRTFQLEDCDMYTSCANTRKDAAKFEFDDDFIYREIRRPVFRRKIPMKQLLRDEAMKAFAEWHRKADRTPY